MCGSLWYTSLYDPHLHLGRAFTLLHTLFSHGSVLEMLLCSGSGRNLSFWDCTDTCKVLIVTEVVSLSEILYLSGFWLQKATEAGMCLLGTFSSWPEANAQTGIQSGRSVNHLCLPVFNKCKLMRKVWYHLNDTMSIVSLIGSYQKRFRVPEVKCRVKTTLQAYLIWSAFSRGNKLITKAKKEDPYKIRWYIKLWPELFERLK